MKDLFPFIRMLVGAPLILIGVPFFTLGLMICGRDFARGFLRGWMRSNQLDPETKN